MCFIIIIYHHRSLKTSVPTRWNSVLTMITSIIDLFGPLDETIKVTGNFYLCISEYYNFLLKELKEFIAPFERYTMSVSGGTLHAHASLSLITLIKANIKQRMINITTATASNESIIELANAILHNLDNRFPINDLVQIATLLNPSIKSLMNFFMNYKGT